MLISSCYYLLFQQTDDLDGNLLFFDFLFIAIYYFVFAFMSEVARVVSPPQMSVRYHHRMFMFGCIIAPCLQLGTI